MAELIRADNVYKGYNLPNSRVDVLNGASFSVSDGETVAIIGVSGSGKSTLLHVLGGLDKPDSGSILVRGDDVYNMSQSNRSKLRSEKIGFVFQSYHLLPEMDILENVMVPAMARGGLLAGISGIKDKAMNLLKTVGLEDRASHTPMELSGGEQQRVALARALMNNPDIILADEPTGNLDEGTGGLVLEHLFSLVKGSVHALILVTHNREVAKSCGRVLELRDGIIVDSSI